MEFCDNCGSMLIIDPEMDELICPSCGLTQRKFETKIEIVRDHSHDDNKIFIQGPSDDMPSVPASCPICGNSEAYVWTQMIGFGVTKQVQCYRCTKCGNTWR